MKVSVPGQLKFLSDVIGEEETFAFIENVAGTKISLPKKSEGSIFEKTHGKTITDLCIEEWGDGQRIIAKFQDWRIRKLKEAGLTHNQIVARVGCPYSVVSQTLQRRQVLCQKKEKTPSLEEIFPQIEMFETAP